MMSLPPLQDEIDEDEGAVRELAKAAANELFRNGSGQIASRLVMELPGGRNGGGYCHAAVVEVIAQVLRDRMKPCA
jgi:hypothetical protein